MTIEEIIYGESKNIEFKVMLPEKSEKYIKTIIAFANTQGGRLIIGIDDKTREIVGVDEDLAFHVMDRIANAVSDSCVPQLVPNIELHTIAHKTVIVVTVAPGPGRPYYLKLKGKDNGTYIRVAGTTRPAQPEKIKELEMEGARISWDELRCIGYEVTETAVNKLCSDIMKYRKEAGLPKRNVTKSQLINWRILQEDEDGGAGSNAFVLLTSDYFPFSKTQCAVFKGTERTVFLDKREFTGSIYEQIEESINFVLRNIRLGATIDGIVRKELYELPVGAIREMIVNAHCHRNMSVASCIQVALYDDRLEVTSPGGLYNGLTYEEIMNGHSRLRNRSIANVLNQMGLVESWGTGIRRIMDAAEDYALPIPEFQVFDNMFRVILFRKPLPMQSLEDMLERLGQYQKKLEKASEKYQDSIGETLEKYQDSIGETSEKYQDSVGETSEKYQDSIGETSEKHRRNIGEASEKNQNIEKPETNDTQQKILELLSKDPQLSAAKLAEQIGIASRNIESNIKKLKEQGILIRHGSPKSGYWEIAVFFPD